MRALLSPSLWTNFALTGIAAGLAAYCYLWKCELELRRKELLCENVAFACKFGLRILDQIDRTIASRTRLPGGAKAFPRAHS